jgi:hypothetical protein
MFVPLHDGVPLRFMRAPYITYGLVGTSVGLFLLMWLRESESSQIAVAAGFGLIPSVLFGTAQLPTDLLQAPVWLTLFSNILLHASFAHLGGNMLFLWVFGDNVEDAMGHLRFLLFFFICGLAGSLAHAQMNPAADRRIRRDLGRDRLLSDALSARPDLGPGFQLDPAAHHGALCAQWLDPVSDRLGNSRSARPCRLVGPSRWARRRRGADADLHPSRRDAVRPPGTQVKTALARPACGVDKRKRASLRSVRIPAESRDAAFPPIDAARPRN